MSGLRPRPMIITIAITLITRFMYVVGDLKLLSYFYVNLSDNNTYNYKSNRHFVAIICQSRK